jgi:hypothetical protein
MIIKDTLTVKTQKQMTNKISLVTENLHKGPFTISLLNNRISIFISLGV